MSVCIQCVPSIPFELIKSWGMRSCASCCASKTTWWTSWDGQRRRMRVAYTRRIETSIYTHERERERGRGKGNRENTGRQSFPPILHFLFFAHWQGERKSFCSQKVAMTREWNIKRATVGRDREGHRVRRGGEKRKKKEEKCRTRQLFLPFFFFPQVIYYFFFLFESEMPRASWSKKLCRSMANPSDALPRTAAVDGCDSRPRPAVSQLRRPRNSMALMMP